MKQLTLPESQTSSRDEIKYMSPSEAFVSDGKVELTDDIRCRADGPGLLATDVMIGGRPLFFIGETEGAVIQKGTYSVREYDDAIFAVLKDRSDKKVGITISEVKQQLKLRNYDYGFQFRHLNPMQERVFLTMALQKQKNLVVSAPTASGKTLIAELALAKALDNYMTGVYIAPTKALADQKVDEFKSGTFADFEVIAITSDTTVVKDDGELNDVLIKRMENADILVMTPEMLASKITKLDRYECLKDIGTIVVDEAHFIGSKGRGDRIEAMLVQTILSLPKVQIVLLSATINDLERLQDWLTHVTKRPTTIVSSDFRPSKLQIEYIPYQDIWYKGNDYSVRTAMLASMIQNSGGKWLVFCASREGTKIVAESLRNLGFKAEYHNAALEYEKRKEVERAFIDGDLEVLVSTTTLAVGINAPARSVAVLDIARGNEEIDAIDILQMIGRAGRPQYDPVGYAYIFCPPEELDNLKWRMANIKVNSMLMGTVPLKMHLNNMVYQGLIRTVEDFNRVMKSTFGYFQYTDDFLSTAQKCMDWLIKTGYISSNGSTYKPAWKGRVAAMMYQNPIDISWWCVKFGAMNWCPANDIELAYALTAMTHIINSGAYVTRNESYQMRNFCQKYDDDFTVLHGKFGAFDYDTERKYTWLWWNVLNGNPDNVPNTTINALKEDSQRLIMTLKLLCDRNDVKPMLDRIGMRLKYGVADELVELVSIRGIGAARAERLSKEGIKTITDIINNKDKIYLILGKKIGDQIISDAVMKLTGGRINGPGNNL